MTTGNVDGLGELLVEQDVVNEKIVDAVTARAKELADENATAAKRKKAADERAEQARRARQQKYDDDKAAREHEAAQLRNILGEPSSVAPEPATDSEPSASDPAPEANQPTKSQPTGQGNGDGLTIFDGRPHLADDAVKTNASAPVKKVSTKVGENLDLGLLWVLVAAMFVIGALAGVVGSAMWDPFSDARPAWIIAWALICGIVFGWLAIWGFGRRKNS